MKTTYALPLLTERAGLAVNCLTNHVDPDNGCIPFFYTRLGDHPPFAFHDIWSYGDGLGRSVDALALCRTMIGENCDQPTDRAMLKTLLGLIREDGLSWCPAQPWTMPFPHTRPAWLQQGTLLALTTIYQLTGDEKYRIMAGKNIQGILNITTSQQDELRFPGEYYSIVHGWHVPDHEDPNHKLSVFSSSVTMPLMRYYRLTGYEPALLLANGLINWGLNDHDHGQRLFQQGHFHCQSRLLIALLMRGIAVGSNDDIQLGEQLYLKAKTVGTTSGWFPEQINNPEFNRENLSETCCLTDMIEAAILLAQHRNPNYWNDVERYARNYLLVHQYTDFDWLDQITDRGENEQPIGFDREHQCLRPGHHSPEIKKTLIGGFVGWGGVTAISDNSAFSNINQHCCNAAGARALYDVWYNIVTDDGKNTRINLHLTRNHPSVEINVTEGESLRMVIKIKKERRLQVRIPDFVKPHQIKVICNESDLQGSVMGNWIELEILRAGSTVIIDYPLSTIFTRERVAGKIFEFRWRGATVHTVSPVLGLSPLFVSERFKNVPVSVSNCPAVEGIVPF